MSYLLSAWPALCWALPALVLLSATVFLARGNRRGAAQLAALVALFVMAALLMEFFTFMDARMARPGGAPGQPELGQGTRALLATMAHPRSVTAAPLSLPWLAAWSVPASYLWLLATWALHLRGPRSSPGRAKAGKTPRKKAARG